MNMYSPTFNRRARTKARRSTVQALYQWFMTGKDVVNVIDEFESDKQKLAKTDIEYFKLLLKGTIKYNDELDTRIVKLLDRRPDELDTVERAILHIGCYELKYHPEIPWRVVINESIELAKLFGAEQSHKYINAVLDKVVRELRAVETDTIFEQSP